MTTWRGHLLRWLRVPPEPTSPVGDEGVRIFRAAPNYFRYKMIIWGMRQVGGLIALVAYLTVLEPRIPDVGPPSVTIGPLTITRAAVFAIYNFFEIVGIVVYVVQMFTSAAMLRLDFEQRWYLVSDRSLRIREGLVRLDEKTMTFANVQHVAIRQNPIQRWLDIADVEVRTAGGGGNSKGEHDSSSDLHIAYLRGVVDPERIRDVIRERLKRHDDAGLGDPESPPTVGPRPVAAASELLAAASALREEARALRLVLAKPVDTRPDEGARLVRPTLGD
jgi:membrane protein YdbS with pleckstrin-like domain